MFRTSFLNLEGGQNNFYFHPHNSQEQQSDKRLDGELIKSYCQNVSDCEVFICGNNSFTQNMIETLKKLGVEASVIHFESFDSFKENNLKGNVGSTVSFSASNKNLIINWTNSKY